MTDIHPNLKGCSGGIDDFSPETLNLDVMPWKRSQAILFFVRGTSIAERQVFRPRHGPRPLAFANVDTPSSIGAILQPKCSSIELCSPPSQPIQVDGRSLVDLKAIVYEKEQTVKQDAVGGKTLTAGGIRGQRGRREAAAAEANAAAARKDVFARKNAGVEDRSRGDDLERVSQSRKRKAAERALAAKSKLYEKMGECFCPGVSQELEANSISRLRIMRRGWFNRVESFAHAFSDGTWWYCHARSCPWLDALEVMA